MLAMKSPRHAVVLYALLLPIAAHAQSPSDPRAAKLLQNRYSLTLSNGQFTGPAAQLLQSAVAQSHFILVGEQHGFAQSPSFWSALCSIAVPAGFHSMAIEEGPLAAGELEQWSTRVDGEAQLIAFRKQFPESIDIYTTHEDFAMLQHCARASQSPFHLWGLNQEALGASPFVFQRILDTHPGPAAASAMQQLLQQNDAAYTRALQTGNIDDLFMISASDHQLARDAQLLQQENPEAQSLFASFIESHQINRVSPADPANAARRTQLMIRLFTANYAAATRTESPPKVLFRFGALHIYRGLNPVHGHGIGSYIAGFAAQQHTQSLHILIVAVAGSAPGFHRIGHPQPPPQTFDIKNDPFFYPSLEPFLNHLYPSGFTVFDLRPLRADLSHQPHISPAVANLISGIDLLVLIPKGTPTTDLPPDPR
jgi:hypothetical protein